MKGKFPSRNSVYGGLYRGDASGLFGEYPNGSGRTVMENTWNVQFCPTKNKRKLLKKELQREKKGFRESKSHDATERKAIKEGVPHLLRVVDPTECTKYRGAGK